MKEQPKTIIEKFKELFPDSEYDHDNNAITAYYPDGSHMVSLWKAQDLIDDYYVGNVIESNELNPEDRVNILVSARDYILSEYNGYTEAFKAI